MWRREIGVKYQGEIDDDNPSFQFEYIQIVDNDDASS